MTVDLGGLLADHTARSKVPGAAVAVTHDTGVLDAYAGVADMTTSAGVTPERSGTDVVDDGVDDLDERGGRVDLERGSAPQ